MNRTAVAVVVAMVLAMALAAAGVYAARFAGVDIDLFPTIITALVVGAFLALLLFAPRNGDKSEAEGFDVVASKRQDEVVEVKQRR